MCYKAKIAEVAKFLFGDDLLRLLLLLLVFFAFGLALAVELIAEPRSLTSGWGKQAIVLFRTGSREVAIFIGSLQILTIFQR